MVTVSTYKQLNGSQRMSKPELEENNKKTNEQRWPAMTGWCVALFALHGKATKKAGKERNAKQRRVALEQPSLARKLGCLTRNQVAPHRGVKRNTWCEKARQHEVASHKRQEVELTRRPRPALRSQHAAAARNRVVRRSSRRRCSEQDWMLVV